MTKVKGGATSGILLSSKEITGAGELCEITAPPFVHDFCSDISCTGRYNPSIPQLRDEEFLKIYISGKSRDCQSMSQLWLVTAVFAYGHVRFLKFLSLSDSAIWRLAAQQTQRPQWNNSVEFVNDHLDFQRFKVSKPQAQAQASQASNFNVSMFQLRASRPQSSSFTIGLSINMLPRRTRHWKIRQCCLFAQDQQVMNVPNPFQTQPHLPPLTQMKASLQKIIQPPDAKFILARKKLMNLATQAVQMKILEEMQMRDRV
ncbi:hypothetical protein EV361DRAFT_1035593 [Lentinula raphanica]|nr:hypothetical protein EV361DRAFT_1035593 [Lentinula raphanica]